jgi:two-component system LytT family response regulator
MIKTILVDDEEHALNRLSYMLKDQDNIDVVASCNNGIKAIEEITKHEPDLVFLDIEMPEVNGFDVISNLKVEHPPIVIFVTAFSEYAVKAFEVNALDYVHKPFDKNRLGLAIEKAEQQLKNYNADDVRLKIEKLLKTKEHVDETLNRFVLKSAGSIYIVKTQDVLWIEAAGNYINIITEKKKYLLRSTLSSVKDKLDSLKFFQIHRSTIVNVD